jgi:DNA-binding LytR/AlgR family response regulator
MIKIGIYSNDSNQKKQIKASLKKYFNDLKMESDIRCITTKKNVLKNFTDRYSEYKIVLFCEENRINYIKRNLVNHLENFSSQTVGWTDLPLNTEKINEIIFNEDYHNCPRGVYVINTKTTVRAVSYGDIEYCQWINDKTVIFLKNNETEEITDSIKDLKKELPEDYFADCLKGYIINLYNVKKIDRSNHQLIMNSGSRISINQRKYSNLVRLFIRLMFGI